MCLADALSQDELQRSLNDLIAARVRLGNRQGRAGNYGELLSRLLHRLAGRQAGTQDSASETPGSSDEEAVSDADAGDASTDSSGASDHSIIEDP